MSEAKQVLEKVISDFSVAKFGRFFREKNRQFIAQEENYSRYSDDDFKNGIKLGEINFSDGDSLIICAFEVKQELSERAGKKAQYEKAKNILKSAENQQYSAAIFIFHDSSGNFRFSLIYPKSIGTRRQWSNFRRFTYFVSREFTNKTFLQRINDSDFSSLEKIQDAFSVEKITKEFYLEYHKLFESLLDELSKNHTFLNEASKNQLNTENFAKKLLGQIVFLYFVQKKGWLGVPEGGKWGEGNKNFLSNLFREAKNSKNNFFNDYLEKLFYNALNNPRRDSVDPSFSKDFNCRIPFLNGGLFEAEYNWRDSSIYLDDKIFQAIFEVFDRYNFTVEEESPDDKEIAIDPEMLGKVFENLLSENLRKGKGTYYTPREIVYYMCQESLINYLDSASKIGRKKAEKYVKFLREGENKSIAAFEGEVIELDELLKNIKVCDPACGSGAFLVGMLNEIVRLRLLLRMLHPKKLAKKTEYELKKETIQNCIYGVDIDPGAIEIAKLRLWLQLVVDYELKDIEPLPNLDYRLMCGNSLLEEFEGVKFYNGEDTGQQTALLVDRKKQRKIIELKKNVKEYFDIHDDKEKQAKRKEINDIKDWLIRLALEKRKQDLEAQRKNEEAKANMLNQKSREKYLASWGDKFLAEAKIKEVLDNLHNPKKEKPFFLWKLEFIDVFEDKKGFDVVIGNPPYVQLQKDGGKLADMYKNCGYKSFERTGDIYSLFYENGINTLKTGGHLCFITSNKWMRAGYGKSLRKLFNSYNPLLLVDLGPGIFETATVDTNILIIEKGNNYGQLSGVTLNTEVKDSVLSDFIDKNKNILPKMNEDAWFIGNQAEQNLKEKIERIGKPLKEWDVNIYRGVITGLNEAFIIDTAVRDRLVADDPRSAEILKPILRGRDIKRFDYEWAGLWVILIKYGFHRELNKFPAILKHLTQYEEKLKNRGQCRYSRNSTGEGQHHWLELDNNPKDEYLNEFKKEKVVWKRIGSVLRFGLDNESMYCQDSTCIMTGSELKYLCAFMNSKLGNQMLYDKAPKTGTGDVIVSVQALEPLLIPPITPSNKDIVEQIEHLVDKILAITKSIDYLKNPAKKEEVKEYEKQINQLVYKLYDLTPEEIKIVERD